MHPTVCIRRNAFWEAGGYSGSFEGAEDFELWLRMSRRGLLANLPDNLLLYRVHSGQVSSKKSALQRQSHAAALEYDRRNDVDQLLVNGPSATAWKPGTVGGAPG
jgi:Glycosyltransferase like family 2